MTNTTSQEALFEQLISNLESKRFAEVFRYISFKPFETFKKHQHIRIEINHVKKGSCFIELENETISFKEGELMIICSDILHSFQSGPNGCTLMQLEFLPDMLSSFDLDCENIFSSNNNQPDIFSLQSKVIKIINNTWITNAVLCIIDELQKKKNHYRHIVIMRYMELLIHITRHMKENYLPLCTNETLKKAIGYIRCSYHDDINIGEVALQAEVSERYLRKIFAKYLNLSPIDYLNQIRINKAVELITLTEQSIKEICFLCGFKSPQYFSRVFKQYVGIAPKDFKTKL
ncbi:MAG: AraC family transcriptional regulator [Tannerellaceae bacterium]